MDSLGFWLSALVAGFIGAGLWRIGSALQSLASEANSCCFYYQARTRLMFAQTVERGQS